MPGVAVPVSLTDAQRAELLAWSRRPTTAQALSLRAEVVLAAAKGSSNIEISDDLGVSFATVSKWRNRFAKFGLDGLADAPRSGAPRSVSDDDVNRVIAKTLEEKPPNAT